MQKCTVHFENYVCFINSNGNVAEMKVML